VLIDSHAHLDMRVFEGDRPCVLRRALESGITHILTIGIDLESSMAAVQLARKNEPVYAAVGYHPHNASREPDARTWEELIRAAADPKVVAWGEIGLDFYRRYSPPEAQRRTFQHQMEIAHELNLPVIIHDRDAHREVLTLLKKTGGGKRKGVIHCFSGDVEMAETCISLGYAVSIPGTVTYKNATMVREVAATVPLECLLVETDAPFLSPVPKRGERNEPAFVTFTVREIARLRNTPYEEIARATAENAKLLFKLP
jgi:TatD DNase family protein